MYWINFLHIYQPPWQNKKTIDQIADKCYLPLFKLLEKNKSIKIVLNICASLTELLDKFGYKKIIHQIKKLATRKQIEFTGSAAYHAFLPLLPESEIKRQIILNQKINKYYFGSLYNPKGFFSPEMGYSFRVAKIVKSLGFQWMLAHPVALTKKEIEADSQTIYKIQKLENFFVFFSHHKFSDSVSQLKTGREYLCKLKKLAKQNNYIITATDGEMYGHHNKNGIKILEYVYRQKSFFCPFLISDLLKIHEKFKIKNVTLFPSSWSTRSIHYKENVPYPLWQHPKNKIHKTLWQLARLAIQIVNQHKSDKNFFWARHHLDLGLSSCTFWWAAGEINWNPEEIEHGLLQLIKSFRSLKNLPPEIKIKVEKLYSKIIYEIWRKHWSGEIQEIQKKSVLIKK